MAVKDQYSVSSKSSVAQPYMVSSYTQGAYEPAGFYPSSRPSLHKGRKYQFEENPPVRQEPRQPEVTKSRGCLIAMLIIGLAVLVAAGITLGIVFGVVTNTSKKGKEEPSRTPEVSYATTLELDQDYTPALDNPDSPTYKSLKEEIESEMNPLLQDLGPSFIGASVVGFSEGSIISKLKLDFDADSIAPVGSNQVKRLTDQIVLEEVKAILTSSKATTFVQRNKLVITKTAVIELEGTGSAVLGDGCTHKNNCSGAGDGTICAGTPLLCKCDSGHFDSNTESMKRGICIPKKEDGAVGCKADSHCKSTQAVCVNGLCTCDSTTRFHKNGACIPKILIDEEGCADASDCASSVALCTAGSCVCPITHFTKNRECVEKIGINQAGCSSDTECATSAAVCSSGSCICPMKYYFDNDNCVENCYDWVKNNKIQEKCSESLIKLMTSGTEEDRCRHYENVWGCIMYQATISDVVCHINTDFVLFVKDVVFSKADYNLCPGHDLTYLVAMVPTSKQGICEHTGTTRYLLEYKCVRFSLTELDEKDKCIMRHDIKGCVFGTLNTDAGCTSEEVDQLLERQEVQQGFIDSIPVNCDAILPTTPCAQNFYLNAGRFEQCFVPLYNMHFLNSFTSLAAVNGFDLQHTFKCSVYIEAIKCILGAIPHTYQSNSGDMVQCKAVDTGPLMKESVKIFHEVASRSMGGMASFVLLDFTECDALLTTVTSSVDCPSKGIVGETIVAACSYQVIMGGQQQQPCDARLYREFKGCLDEVKLRNEDKCPTDYKWRSLKAHDTDVRALTGGMNPAECRDDECTLYIKTANVVQSCSGAYSKLTSMDTPAGDMCEITEDFLGCILFHQILAGMSCSLEVSASYLETYHFGGNLPSVCPGHDYTYVSNQLPDNKPGLCDNSASMRYLMKYGCILYDITILQDDESRCAAFFGIRWCVLQTMQYARCTMEDVIRVTQRSEVRIGLLDNIPDDCDTRLPTQCALEFFGPASINFPYCFGSVFGLHTLNMVQAVDSLFSPDGQTKLKCSVYTDSIICAMNAMSRLYENEDGDTRSCTVLDVAANMKLAIKMFYDITYQTLESAEAKQAFKVLHFEECEDTLPTEKPATQCPSTSSVATMLVATCSYQIILQMRNMQSDPCEMKDIFNGCVDSVPLPEPHLCPAGDYKLSAIEEHSDYIADVTGGFNPVTCKETNCATWFHHNSIHDKCSEPYDRLKSDTTQEADKCNHYQAYLGCINHYKVVDGINCQLEEIDNYLRETLYKGRGYSLCQGVSIALLVSALPSDAAGICSNDATIRFLLGYRCIAYDLNLIQGPEFKCRAQLAIGGCVLMALNDDVPCTMDEINAMMEKPSVRQGLLDAIPNDCDTQLQEVKQCERHFYEDYMKYVSCLEPINQLFFLNMGMNVNSLDSSSGNGKLICSVYSEQLKCVMKSFRTTGECTILDVNGYLKDELQMYFDVIRTFIPENVRNLFTNIDFTECDDHLPTVIEEGRCPDASTTVDIVAAACLNPVIDGIVTHQRNPCDMMNDFSECIKRTNIFNVHYCPDQYVWNSVMSYSSFYAGIGHGFTPSDCIPMECANWFHEKSIHDKCSAPFDKLTSDVPQEKDKCHYYHDYLGCINHNKLVYGVNCTLAEIDTYLKETLYKGRGFNLCPEVTIAQLASFMPSDKAAVCSHDGTIRFLLEYMCIAYDLNLIRGNENKCRAELAIGGCVFMDLYPGIGCTMDQINTMISKPSVREGLLGAIPNDCDTQLLQISPCERHFYKDYTKVASCLEPIHQLYYLNMGSSVDSLTSSSGTGKLKCNVYNEQLKCAMNSFRSYYNDPSKGNEQCTIQEVNGYLKDELEMYYEVSRALLPEVFRYLYTALDFTDCAEPQDTGKGSCPSVYTTVDIAAATCLNRVREGITIYQQPPCNMLHSFADCVDKIQINEMHVCPERYLWTNVMSNPEFYTSIVDGFNPYDCIYQDFKIWFHYTGVEKKCKETFSKLTSQDIPESDKCGHYQSYLGCINHHSLIDSVTLPLDQLDTYLRETVYQGAQGFRMCDGFTISDLAQLLPTDKTGVCSNAATARFLLQYKCLTYDLSMITKEEDKCRAQFSLIGCLFQSLNEDFGCTMDDLSSLISTPAVRNGFLNDIPIDCMSKLQPCEQHFYEDYTDLAPCFEPLHQLHYLNMGKAVDSLSSSSGTGKLKCSVYNEQLKCVMKSFRAHYTNSDGINVQCTIADVNLYLKDEQRMFYDVTKLFLPENVRHLFTAIDFTECDANLPTSTGEGQCPSVSASVDIVAATCLSGVMDGIWTYQQTPCSMVGSFSECVGRIKLHEADVCPQNYLWNNAISNSDYFDQIVDGFNPSACQSKQVLLQTVKTKKKCRICSNSSGSALFAKIKQSTSYNRKFNSQPLEIQWIKSILTLSTCTGKSIRIKRLNKCNFQ